MIKRVRLKKPTHDDFNEAKEVFQSFSCLLKVSVAFLKYFSIHRHVQLLFHLIQFCISGDVIRNYSIKLYQGK